MKVALDIGAHDGRDSLKLLKEGYRVYAFEPLKNRYDKYFRPIEDAYENFTLLQLGIDKNPGLKKFYDNTGLGTISSLYELDKSIVEEKWPGQDLDKSITVREILCITLFDFCTYANIDRIDYLHCDTQGNDLNVLESLGSKIDMVQKGVVETSGTKSLYYSNNSKEAVIKFLINCNFKIDKEELLGDGSIEYNIHFSKI
jgi:FkbM family methyltransferase